VSDLTTGLKCYCCCLHHNKLPVVVYITTSYQALLHVTTDSGVSTADDPHAEGWQLGMPFSVETKEGHAEAAMAPVILPNALRKPSNVLQVLATPAWPV